MAPHFSPWQAPRPCWHCSAFVALIYGGSAAACGHGGVRAMPAQGCAFWQREPGADDEPDVVPQPIRWPNPARAARPGPR